MSKTTHISHTKHRLNPSKHTGYQHAKVFFNKLLEAYRDMGAANSALEGKFSLGTPEASNAAQKRIANASRGIAAARDELLKFLSSDD
jgi:hypothetical protein